MRASFNINLFFIILIFTTILGFYTFTPFPYETLSRKNFNQKVPILPLREKYCTNNDISISYPSHSTDQNIQSIDKISIPNIKISESIGTSKLFWVLNLSTNDFYEINATLKAIGLHTLIYSNLSSVSDTEIYNINDAFENIIYPNLTSVFGLPPDIDSNNKIIILLFDIIDGLSGGQYVAGFFYSLNQYYNSDLPPSQRFSNEAEILHIDELAINDYETIAHEFQHLIHFEKDPDEERWIDEGASMLSEYITGYDSYNSSSQKVHFESNPNVSLTYWDYSNEQDLLLANYGASYAFFRYLSEKYGGTALIKEIVQQADNGISGINKSLLMLGYNVKFVDLFRNWTVANFLNNISLDEAYGYQNISFNMSIEHTYDFSPLQRTNNKVTFWGTDYLEFMWDVNNQFNFEFQGLNSSNFLVTVLLSNKTSNPSRVFVSSINISNYGLGFFSTSSIGVSADKINIIISAYPKSGTSSFNDTTPSPEIDYWITVNPNGLFISEGNISRSDFGTQLRASNIIVNDLNGHVWQIADGAFYEILNEFGGSTGITGVLVYNTSENYWETGWLNISKLSIGKYRLSYYFFNLTSSGIFYSTEFKVIALTIFPGQLEIESRNFLRLRNVTVFDNSNLYWNTSEGAFFEIITEFNTSTGIISYLSFNNSSNKWESGWIDISSLSEGSYQIKFHFYNSTTSAILYWHNFVIESETITETSSDFPSSTITTQIYTSLTTVPKNSSTPEITSFPGILIILLILSFEILILRNKYR